MKYSFILGVDVSKEWLNLCLMNSKLEIIGQYQIDNNVDSIFSFLAALSKEIKLKDWAELIVVMEHTGTYIQHLTTCCLSKGAKVSVVPAFKITEHLAGKVKFEEKNDAMDARRIAEYGVRFTDKLNLFQASNLVLTKLKRLQGQRKRMLDALKKLEVPVNESEKFDSKSVSQMLKNNQTPVIQSLKEAVKEIEKQMDELIKNDPTLTHLFELMISVDGIGKVTATEILIATNGFENFKPNQAKAFARYAGAAPGPNQSGKKIKRKKTPKRANKKVKQLLTMGATSLIGTKSDLGKYYQRKIEEGKAHFSVINAMRNKLILRVFAVVRNQVIYDKDFNYSFEKP